MHSRGSLTLLLPLGLLLRGAEAPACSCAQPTLAEELQSAVAVFQGTVRAVTPLPQGRRDGYTRFLMSVEVSRSWLGARAGQTVQLESGDGDADCGFLFTVGQSYVVFAFAGRDGRWSTSSCTRTTPSAGASALVRELDARPRVP